MKSVSSAPPPIKSDGVASPVPGVSPSLLLLALLLVSFLLLGAGTAQAQTTLVSNTGQTSDGGGLLVGYTGPTSHWSRALSFTTGSNSLGYTLSAVDVKLRSGTHATNTRVSIYTASGDPAIPGSSLHVLNNPSSLVASAINTFSANSGAALDKETTYFVVIEIPSGFDDTTLDRTDSDDEDSDAADGWSIGNRRHTRNQIGNGLWTVATGTEKPMIAIKGTAKTAPPRPPTPPPVIKSPKGVRVGNPDDVLPITLKKGDSIPLTPLGEGGDFLYRERTIDLPVTRDECTFPGNPAVILSKEILDRVYDRSQEIAFELSGTSPQDPPPGFRMEGCALEIDPGVALREGETVTVCLPHAGIQGKSYIHRYNDESGEWEPLQLETVDDEELLCGETDTLSPFRVFVPVIDSEEVTHRESPKDVFSLTPIGEGGSMRYGQKTIGISVTGDTDPSYANPAVIVSREILDDVSEITFELSEVSEYPPPGYRLEGFTAKVNLRVPLEQEETVSVCLPSSGGEGDIYYRYNDESEEWEELLESWPDTVNGEDVLCGDAGAVSLSGVFVVEEPGGCVIAAAGGEGVLWRGAVFNLLLIISALLFIPGMSRPRVYDRKASG